ncbi:MAG: ribosome silencing factor [Candidatus Aminicenantes bacterium]|nr:MAG: ribosome silencing factor [Candidatus Aminicenantes bacterium]
MSKEIPKKLDKRKLAKHVKTSITASKEKKAEHIVVLDLRDVSSFTDYFVIMQGNSKRQNMAIYESIEQELKKENIKPLSIEGRKNAEWILMDYGHFIIHIFSKEARDYYYLEKLWGDAPRSDY